MQASELQCALTGRAGYRQAAGGHRVIGLPTEFGTEGILLMKINSRGERLRFVIATTALSISVAVLLAASVEPPRTFGVRFAADF